MIKRELVMKFITERDHLGNEKYKKVTLKVRPEIADSVLRELVDMYCEMTSNELVEATVVDTRDLVGTGDFDEIEEIFFDEEQETPTKEAEEGTAHQEAENSPDKEMISSKKEPEVEAIPTIGKSPESELIFDREEGSEVKFIPDKEGPKKFEKGWTQLWEPKTAKYLDHLFIEKFLKRAKKDNLIGKNSAQIPVLLSRDWLEISNVQDWEGGCYKLLKFIPHYLYS